MSQRLLIIGGVAAGMSAAAKARRSDANCEIRVYTEEEYFSYAGCGLPYFIGGKFSKKEALIARSLKDFAAQRIQVNPLMRVEKIKPADGKIIVKNLQNNTSFEDNYDRLIIATGARPFIPPLEGMDLNGVFSLRTIPDSQKIKDYLLQEKPQKAVVVGGGYIGLEMVENLLVHGCQVTLVEMAPHIVPNMDGDMAQVLTNYLESKGVEIRTGEAIKGFIGKEKITGMITDKGQIPADFALLSIGVQPNSALAEEAGLKLGVKNAIQVNDKMETSVENIYAAGDCATVTHLLTGNEVYIPLGTTANKQGKIAGENAIGGNRSFKGVLGTGIARVIEMEISRTGLSETECQRLGIEYLTSRINAKTAAHFCPISNDINLKLLADKKTRRLIGAQIVGYSGSAMRINMLAAAITSEATVDELIDMDLAYSPPFSPVWDPVLIALNQFQ